jgi:predicted ATP-grasp superfamily ATP-dependent carboligase
MKTNAKVIILGCSHAGLAIARTLGKRGIYAIGVTHDETEFGLFSCYLKETAICPHPKDSRAFIDFLLIRVDSWVGALLLETSDYYMLALSQYKAELSEHYRLIAPDPDIAEIFIEKDKTYALADDANVPHPNIFKPTNLKDLDAIADQILLPVMIKPVVSHEFVQIFNTKSFICQTFDELQVNFQRTLEVKQPVVISEIIPGTDYRTMEKVMLYINTKGDISAEFFNIKLRQSPPMFGRMRVGKSTPVNQEVLELSRRLLKQINYRGYASVEFKRDYRDNQLKLMEVNIRQPLGSILPIASGVDFPWIIYQDLIMDKQVRIDHYHENTYLIDLTDDVVNFIRLDPSKNIIRFLQPYFGRKTFTILDWRDMKPFLKNLKNLGSRIIINISASKKSLLKSMP